MVFQPVVFWNTWLSVSKHQQSVVSLFYFLFYIGIELTTIFLLYISNIMKYIKQLFVVFEQVRLFLPVFETPFLVFQNTGFGVSKHLPSGSQVATGLVFRNTTNGVLKHQKQCFETLTKCISATWWGSFKGK
jgi:hypothetical protein